MPLKGFCKICNICTVQYSISPGVLYRNGGGRAGRNESANFSLMSELVAKQHPNGVVQAKQRDLAARAAGGDLAESACEFPGAETAGLAECPAGGGKGAEWGAGKDGATGGECAEAAGLGGTDESFGDGVACATGDGLEVLEGAEGCAGGGGGDAG